MNMVAEYAAAARHKITVDEAFAMRGKRIFGDRDFELIDGEIVFMGDDGGPTIEWNAAVAAWLIPALLGRPVVVVPDKTLRLSDHSGPKPDFYVYPEGTPVSAVRGGDVLLVIEVADTTLKDDLGWKAQLYAEHGVRDYWVIDVQGRRVLVHRLNADGAYGEPTAHDADAHVEPLLIAGLALRIADLRYVGNASHG
jgi:Uma2 family endonuclease